MRVSNRNVDVISNLLSILSPSKSLLFLVIQVKLKKLIIKNDQLTTVPDYEPHRLLRELQDQRDQSMRNLHTLTDPLNKYSICNVNILFLLFFSLVDEHIRLKYHRYHIFHRNGEHQETISGMKRGQTRFFYFSIELSLQRSA